MEIKIFGKSIFNYKSAKAESLWGFAPSTSQKDSKYLPDFHKDRGGRGFSVDYAILQATSNSQIAVPIGKKGAKAEKSKKEPKAPEKLTPKGVYDLKLLNDPAFKINTDPAYIEKQISEFKDKLNMLSAEEFDMRNGIKEIESIKIRMENRKKYPQFHDFYDQFAYTTSSKIDEVLKKNDYLQLGQVAQFLADMPADAVQTMKDYSAKTKELCGKDAVYYIVADKKDFQKSNSRRDPILLAQSPFGHFWQILGAWDKEMIFLEQL